MKRTILSMSLILFLLAGCLGEEQSVEEPAENEKEKIENKRQETNETENVANANELPEAPLQKHDTGEAVLKLKDKLQEIGYTINEEAFFDETTTWAITDFQLQTDGLLATGIYNEETKVALQETMEFQENIVAGAALPPQAEEVFTAAGSQVLANPYDVLAIVNKENALPEDYTPHDLVVPDVRFPYDEDLPKKQLRQSAADALEELFTAAEEAGYYLFSQSGYRSYETQAVLFENYSAEHGEEAANIFSARPGESEHQTGLTMDISSENVGYQLTVDFGETPEGKWVEENAHHYGFIIRYPKGKEAITEYQYEPWHLRYVGKKTATEIVENNWTLEEYYEDKNQ